MARVVVRATHRRDPFVRVPRSIAEHPGLTWKAKMLLGYLMDRGSHPKGWETTVDELVALGADREFALRGGLDELEKAGYLQRETKGVGGGGRRIVWNVTDENAVSATNPPADENAVSATNPAHEIAETATKSRGNHASHLITGDSQLADESAKVLRAGLWTALERVLGPAKTRTESSIRGRTLEELRKVGATPDEIIARAVTYRARYPRAALTDSALRKHWTALETPARKPKERIADPQLRSLYEANQ